jgi:hypothetical protein
MSALTSFTSTSFGYLIAYFPAGLLGLLGMSFWVKSLHTIFIHFQSATADLGLFLIVMLLALIMTLLLLLPRWLIFEIWWTPGEGPSPEAFEKLSIEGRATAYLIAVEQHYRYHQFYGGMIFGSAILFVGWSTHTGMDVVQRGFSVGAFLMLEVLLTAAARNSLSQYYKRGKAIMS